MKEFEKYMEWHLDHWADVCSDKNEMFNDDLRRFKRWVETANEDELMRQLIGRFEAVTYSYMLKERAEAKLKEMERCYQAYLKEKGEN